MLTQVEQDRHELAQRLFRRAAGLMEAARNARPSTDPMCDRVRCTRLARLETKRGVIAMRTGDRTP